MYDHRTHHPTCWEAYGAAMEARFEGDRLIAREAADGFWRLWHNFTRWLDWPSHGADHRHHLPPK